MAIHETQPEDMTEAGKKIHELGEWMKAHDIRFFAIALDFERRKADASDNLAGCKDDHGEPICKMVLNAYIERFGAELTQNAPVLTVIPKQQPPHPDAHRN